MTNKKENLDKELDITWRMLNSPLAHEVLDFEEVRKKVEFLQKQKIKEEVLGVVNGMNGLVEGKTQSEDYYTGYNQALQDIKKETEDL